MAKAYGEVLDEMDHQAKYQSATVMDPQRLKKVEAWNLVEALRAREGNSVTLFCDNPDFNEQPNCAIEVCGDWTAWEAKRFTDETILDALRDAHDAMTACELSHLSDEG